MSFSVECRMPTDKGGLSRTNQSAPTLPEAISHARDWIEKYHGEADIYDVTVSTTKPVMTHAQIVAAMQPPLS